MKQFTRLFGSLQAFVYHCFDRMVINGYLSGLSRPEQVVYFFRQVLGIPVVSCPIFCTSEIVIGSLLGLDWVVLDA